MNDNFQNTKNAITTYFRGVRTEWGKITWPEKHQVVVETGFVIAIVFVFTVFIYIVDKIFDKLLSFIQYVH
jgi:preprotein translocase, SecE subunit, bacterial